MHINITVDPTTEKEMEVFAQLGKGGDLANSDLEAICRMVSLWLRSGGSLEHVIRQLHSIGSSLQVHTKEGKIMSLGDGLARSLQKYMRAKEQYGLKAILMGEWRPGSGTNETGTDDGKRQINGTKPKNGRPSGENGNGHPAHPSVDAETSGTRLPTHGIQWEQKQFKVVCPDCRGSLRFGEGCVTCDVCGFSEC